MSTIESLGSSDLRRILTNHPVSSPTDLIFFGRNPRPTPFSLIQLTEEQRFAIQLAKKYALEQSIQNALRKQAVQYQQQDLNNIKRNHALILLSRIYVGSISFEIGDEDLKRTFSPFGPIKAVTLSWDATLQKHKGFAFIEYEVPEAASLALEQMNGYTLAGRNLKVGRPSNAPQAGPLETELRSDAKTRSRVYIASIHPELSESDIKTVFEAFGKVEGCTLYPDPKYPGRHRGFGYIEFESEESAISAVSSMNCFDLAGQQLRVARAITPIDVTLPLEANITTKINLAATSTTPSSAVALAAANISAKVMSMDAQEAVTSEASRHSTTTRFSMSTTDNPGLPPPGVFIPSAIGGLKPDPVTDQDALANSCETDEVSKGTASMWDDEEDSAVPIQPNNTTDITEEQPSDPDERIAVDSNTAQSGFLFTSPLSRVLLLENMLDAGDVDEEVEEEVREECARFGEVLRVIIHISGSDVRIFVQFDRSDVTQIACDALNQRFFSGRVVRARLYDEEQFQLHELDN
ncbi:Poly U-binding-splicing factor half pint [Fasciola gigantica]|uniref:Poly U-binding-splicing factor half pint n=1 Tax=Fasciola gigantica TaxID=46835 RepID=A0A504YNK2_FASGI|nr:Poly U-binding-splicing factor half pint [Fasciola gigantica]